MIPEDVKPGKEVLVAVSRVGSVPGRVGSKIAVRRLPETEGNSDIAPRLSMMLWEVADLEGGLLGYFPAARLSAVTREPYRRQWGEPEHALYAGQALGLWSRWISLQGAGGSTVSEAMDTLAGEVRALLHEVGYRS